ncbi:MAG: PIN domain-containing protein [Planctomycetota bacterium]
MSKAFIDTNVVVYANDARDRIKQDRARQILATTLGKGDGVLSTQVLHEYARTAIEKLKQHPDIVMRQITLLERFEIVAVTPHLIRRAIEILDRYRLNFWDASVLAAAESARCGVVYSEDLNAGKVYVAVRVVNPFADGA